MLQHHSGPVYLESAQVTAVHRDRFQVDVITLKTKRRIPNIPYSVPNLDFRTGTGINFSPSTGSLCWVMINSSDPGTPTMEKASHVMAWQPPQFSGSHAANRKVLDQGDICLNTPGGGEILVRSGGLVEIRGGFLARTLYMPLTNTIKSLCQNFELDTLGGSFHWNTYSEDTGDVGSSEFLIGIKELTEDKSAMVKIAAGHSNGGIEISVFDSGGEDQTVSCSWSLSKTGAVSLTAKSSISVKSDTSISVQSPEIVVSGSNTLGISSGDTKIELTPTGINISGPTATIRVSSLTILDSTGVPLLSLAPGQIPILKANLLPFILTHTHPPGGGPPNESGGVVQSEVIAKSTGIA